MAANPKRARQLRALDLFSCVGGHALGLHACGFETAAFVESNEWRRRVLAARFPGVPIHDDVQTFKAKPGAFLVIGGPPCQQTSVAAAIKGKRTGASLWPAMLRIVRESRARWVCVEQPPGNAAWESEVTRCLAGLGYGVARLSATAADFGALHQRRRVFLLAHACLPRLALARIGHASAVEGIARAAFAGNPWREGVPGSLRVADGVSRGLDGSAGTRRQRIEAIGDSNPPVMALAIGLAIREAEACNIS